MATVKQLSDLRRARGLIQSAYSKILGRFGTQTEILGLLTEALVLIKSADVPGGVVEVEVEEVPASSNTAPAELTSSVGDGAIEVEIETGTAEPPPKTPRKRSTGRKK